MSRQSKHDSKRGSPKQNTRSFIIRNTTQNYNVPAGHQPKVLPPVSRTQGTKKGVSPMINIQSNNSFLLQNTAKAAKKGSPTAATDINEG